MDVIGALPQELMASVIAEAGTCAPAARSWRAGFDTLRSSPDLHALWLMRTYDAHAHPFVKAMIRAASAGKHRVVAALLSLQAEPSNDLAAISVLHALLSASMAGHVQVARVLMGAPATYNTTLSSALVVAAQHGREGVIRELLSSPLVDLRANTYISGSAVLAACSSGHVGAAQLLIQHGAPWQAFMPGGPSALSRAADRRDVALLSMLVRFVFACGTKARAMRGEIESAISLAVFKNHPDVISIIIEGCKQGDLRQELLDFSASEAGVWRRAALVEELVEAHGARASFGSLIMASGSGCVRCTKALLGSSTGPALLEEAGAAMLLRASLHGHARLAKMLIHDFGVHAHVPHTSPNAAPLNVAARYGFAHTVQVLVAGGARATGDTLALAASSGSQQTLARLLRICGSGFDGRGMTAALGTAVLAGYKSCVLTLLRHGADASLLCSSIVRRAAENGHSAIMGILWDALVARARRGPPPPLPPLSGTLGSAHTGM